MKKIKEEDYYRKANSKDSKQPPSTNPILKSSLRLNLSKLTWASQVSMDRLQYNYAIVVFLLLLRVFYWHSHPTLEAITFLGVTFLSKTTLACLPQLPQANIATGYIFLLTAKMQQDPSLFSHLGLEVRANCHGKCNGRMHPVGMPCTRAGLATSRPSQKCTPLAL